MNTDGLTVTFNAGRHEVRTSKGELVCTAIIISPTDEDNLREGETLVAFRPAEGKFERRVLSGSDVRALLGRAQTQFPSMRVVGGCAIVVFTASHMDGRLPERGQVLKMAQALLKAH